METIYVKCVYVLRQETELVRTFVCICNVLLRQVNDFHCCITYNGPEVVCSAVPYIILCSVGMQS